MTLDIDLFRKDKDFDTIIQSEKKRFHKLESIKNLDRNELISKHEKLTKLKECYVSECECKETLSELENEIHSEIKQLESEIRNTLIGFGNILNSNVVISQDESENQLIKIWSPDGKNVEDKNPKYDCSHVDLLKKIGGVDYQAGVDVAGSRGYYLKGPAVFLEDAIINLCFEILMKKGYTPVSPPCFMKKDVMVEVAQLSQFDDELYKVFNQDKEDMYLIATSEQPLVALHRDECIKESELPIKYMGTSLCFRQEVGSHGRDTTGIFRVHQFSKIEQFCLTSSDKGESDKMFAELMENSEILYQKLNIPYKIVSIVSGELNLAASIKYDLEGYFPSSRNYRELVSCSNCTDYQSRSVRTCFQKNEACEFVHMLNSTMSATTRTICALLENNQTENGINIPKALSKFMPDDYKTFIPFVNNVCKPVAFKFTKSKRMSLGIEVFRNEEMLRVIKDSEVKRCHSVGLVDEILEIDEKWRCLRFDIDRFNRLKNSTSKIVGEKLKKKDMSGENTKLLCCEQYTKEDLGKYNVDCLKDLIKDIAQNSKNSKSLLEEMENRQEILLSKVGNIVSPVLPKDGVTEWISSRPINVEYKECHELFNILNGINVLSGQVVVGNGGYYLTGNMLVLERAIIKMCLAFMKKKEHVPIVPPCFIREEIISELRSDDDTLFKIYGKKTENPNDPECDIKYLNASLEQSTISLHRDEWITTNQFPIKYTPVSVCFNYCKENNRKNQYTQIEQLTMTSPFDDESNITFKEMLSNLIEFYKSLGIPHRIVTPPPTNLPIEASEYIILEAYYRSTKGYKEIAYLLNTTDYMSRSARIRYGVTKGMDKATSYVHIVYGKIFDSMNMLCAFLENNQTAEGIQIPEALKPFMPERFKTIPFIN
ncbi:hypothetical protein A3Q56_06149 [Intoshia linei]|uniref:serine--tRNA ligase n=1 Tax=Intoshia linei TaxID=1819745 RepID=A0A177AX98_9BILA|nr:hypothetical protein A3Q56_06149 [Intoshia linei]